MNQPAETEAVAALARKARALFESKEVLCAEAVLLALNEGLGGGLDPDRAKGLAMGYGNGMGGSGCACGALTGAVLSVSWFLSRDLSSVEVRKAAGEVHERFKAAHGSACCRVLTKPVKSDPGKHFAHCAGLTEQGAAIAAEVIFSRLPALREGLDHTALASGRSKLSTLLLRLADRLR